MKLIKKILDHSRNKMREEHSRFIVRGFEVVERNNKIWLIHNGVAFYQFSDETPAYEIATKLKEARNTAITFDQE